jgi:autotransporter-associated beta strand protein
MSQTEIQIHDARSLANYRKGNLLVLLATAVVVFGGTKPLQAQTYTNVYWYPASLGGSGTWNSSNSFWSTNSAGSGTLVAPSSGTNYIYNFTGTAGTVTENSSFTVAGINWLTSGYVWTSGANRTLTGTDATATGTNTISITNNANLTIAGSGFTFDALSMTGGAAATLTLSNAAGATTTNIFGTSSGKGGRTNFVNTIVAGAGTNVLGTKSSAGFTQAGNITNNSAGMLVLTNSTNGTLSVSGAISGSGALTLANPSTGRIALNASNSYSGGTTVISTGGGQINLGDSAALGTGTVTIADAGTNYVRAAANSLNFANAFVINNGSTLRLGATNTSWKSTLSGTISGAGGIYYAVSDNGLSLTATNSSFGGGINIGSSGVLYVTSLGMAGGNSSIGTNETITLSSESGTSGASSVVWLGRSNEISDKTFALSAISTSPSQGVKIYAGDTSQGGTNVTLTLSGGITSTSTGNKVVTFGAYNTNTLIVNGLINQTAGYTNSVVIGVTGQNGTVVLGNTNNSFGAGVTINAGSSSTNIVQVAAIGSAGANSALGTNGTIHIGGSSSTGANILKYTGSGETSDKVINLAGTTGGATLDQSGTGNLKFTSAMTATGVGSKTLTLQGSTAGSGELSADLSNLGGNSISLVKNGSGTWMLSGNNTYNGATTVSAGTLQIGNGGTSGTLGTGSVANSGVLDFKRSDAYAVSNAISGAGSLVQSGGGTLTLSGANTYSGGTTVSAGSLAVGANDVLGSGAVTVNGGTLDLGNYSDTVGVVTLTSGAISGSGGTLTGSSYAVESGSVSAILGGNGALTKSTAGMVTLSGNNTYSGLTTIRGAGGSLRMASTGALSTATALIGSSSSAETATLDLAAAGNYVAKSYGTTSSAGFNMNFTNSSGGAATLTFTNANNYVTHSSAGSGGRSLVNQSANLTVQFDGDIDIGSSVSDTVTFGGAGNFRINGSLTNGGNGVRALEKTGAGTLTLAGANNNYNGATTVKTGTLVIATGGAITSVASVSNAASMIIQSGASAGELSVSGMATVNGTAGSTIVNNGGTLKGTGTVSALTIASGGTLAVGNSPGQLNVAGNAEWAGGGIYSWELASALGNTTSPLAGQGTNWDFLNVTGILNITASSSPGNRFIIDIASLLPSGDTSFNPNENYSFAIATAAGGFTYGGSAGAFNSALFEITGYQANSGNWSLGVTGASGSSQSLLLAYAGATAIPEPSCSLLMGLGLVAILGLRSSRRKSA